MGAAQELQQAVFLAAAPPGLSPTRIVFALPWPAEGWSCVVARRCMMSLEIDWNTCRRCQVHRSC